MRRGLVIVALVLLGGASVWTDEDPARDAASLIPNEALDAVLSALERKDNDALRSYAASDSPDPWIVAEELCYRGEREAALAFARAAPRPAVASLPAYLETWSPDTDARKALAAIARARLSHDPRRALAVSAGSLTPDSVTRIRGRSARRLLAVEGRGRSHARADGEVLRALEPRVG
jgi:hypothetical protein